MRVKKVLVYVLIAFAVFYLLSRPASAAQAVNGVFDGIIGGAEQLATFVSNIRLK